jgi:hypothetical protein
MSETAVPDDDQLILQIRSGNAVAFGQVFREWYGRLVLYAFVGRGYLVFTPTFIIPSVMPDDVRPTPL